MWRTLLSASIVLPVLLFGTVRSHAAPISPFRSAGVSACLTAPCFNRIGSDGALVTWNQILIDSDGSTLVSGGSAVSTFGTLQASASSTLNRISLGNGWTLAYAEMTDAMVVTSPFAAGVGFLSINYALDGTIVESGNVNSSAEVLIGLDRDGSGSGVFPTNSRTAYTSSVSGRFTSSPQAFDWNVPFNLFLSLFAAVGNVALGAGTPISGLAPVIGLGVGTANFGSTLTIDSVSLFDDQMRPISAATLVAASGTNYKIASVPEPATLALIALGSAAVHLRRRSRMRKTPQR
jgi:hypothetical protein